MVLLCEQAVKRFASNVTWWRNKDGETEHFSGGGRPEPLFPMHCGDTLSLFRIP
jgi:hypothetical protein